MVSEVRPSRAAGPRGVYAKTPQRRREIVEAAAAVFAERGYSGGSLRQIAKDIGVSVTSVMHHFPSKELLLEAVLDHADAEGIREIDLDPARDGVRTTIVRLAENGQGHPHLLRLLAVLSSEASAAEHPAHEWFVARYQRVVDGMTDWIAVDESLDLAPGTARVLARRIVALWDGLQLQWLLRPDFDLVAELDGGVAALADQARRSEPPH
ncbi:TetR/AcrR family transcriptional regulator [Promicromonospora sp. NPDC050262]|uniref:TetR/AcrR family transcriptional regulator n=1 Tax=Promicromonospora sp. NPDC050262 TaxID=3155036 RepID=UPI0033C2666D